MTAEPKTLSRTERIFYKRKVPDAARASARTSAWTHRPRVVRPPAFEISIQPFRENYQTSAPFARRVSSMSTYAVEARR